VRLLLDENLGSARLVRDLVAAGEDVETVVGALGAGAHDEAVASYAIAERRVLVTQDQDDFRLVYGATAYHPGLIVMYPSPKFHSTNVVLRALRNIDTTNPDTTGLILSLNEFAW
jgi:hypothetical protein